MQGSDTNSSNPHTRSQAKYDREHTTGFHMKLNKETDRDILEWLSEQDSKQGSIKKLIRAEIARSASPFTQDM